MPKLNHEARRSRVVRRYVRAVKDMLDAADELRKADQALSAESRRPPLQVAGAEPTPTPPEGGAADAS
jgi:hypothetical protein